MQLSLKTLVLATSALCATAAFAANQARVEVPFAFTAKGQSYPAGSYQISLDSSQSLVTMANQSEPSKHISWIAGPAEPTAAPGTVKFDETGGDYTLRSIQVGSKVTPNLDTTGKRGISATTSIGGQ